MNARAPDIRLHGRDNTLTCSKCGSIRLFYNGTLQCPICDKIRLMPSEDYIRKLEKELDLAIKTLQLFLDNSSYQNIFHNSIRDRASAAEQLLSSPQDKDAARMWVSTSLLLAWNSVQNDGKYVTYSEVLWVSEQVITLYSLIKSLKNGQSVVLEDDVIINTELRGLDFVPDSVLVSLKTELNIPEMPDDILWSGETIIKELAFSHLELVRSETISRSLKAVFNERLVPHLNSSKASSEFLDICLKISAITSFTLGPAFKPTLGTLEAPPFLFDFIVNRISGDMDQNITESFFKRMGNKAVYGINGLGYTAIIRNEVTGNYHICYNSLTLLSIATYNRSKDPFVGRAHNIKGKVFEEVLFNGVSGYLNTLHPVNGSKLLRYQLPNAKGDIDVGGYNEDILIVIESKNWDAPNISSLEEEIRNFESKIEYINENLEDLGFNQNLEVRPIFYTPFPPYPKWNDILLIPSQLFLYLYLGQTFGIRDLPLLSEDKRVSTFLEQDEGERAFALDLSDCIKDIPENTFRIQDGIVKDFDESEITVYILTYNLDLMFLICDINASIYEKIINDKLRAGSYLRMALYNVSGGWTPTQLLDYTFIKNVQLPFNPLTELTYENPRTTIIETIRNIWGGTMGDSILDFISKWDIDLQKLIRRLNEKGQNIFSGVGIALGLNDINEHVSQCSCGEIVACSNELFESLRKEYPDGMIKCKYCDPEVHDKISNIIGHEVISLSLGEILIFLAHQNNKHD